MHFKMSSAISFNLDKSKNFSSGNALSKDMCLELENINFTCLTLRSLYFVLVYYVTWLKCILVIICNSTLNPFPNEPWFLRVCSTSLLKTLREKEKLLVTSNFSFAHSVFFSFGELSPIFVELKVVFCKLLQFGRV